MSNEELAILREKVKMFDLYNKNKTEDIARLNTRTVTHLHNKLVEVSFMNQTLYNQSNERAVIIQNLEEENEKLKSKILDLDTKYKQALNNSFCNTNKKHKNA